MALKNIYSPGFEIGFDNIRFGKTEYSRKSVYISKPIEVIKPTQVGLKTIEGRYAALNPFLIPNNTSITYDNDDDIYFFGAIEYWLIKRDFGNTNNIINTYRVPLLPTNVTRISHERLLLTSRSNNNIFLQDTGYLMFFADEEKSDIKIYRNGILMSSSEWTNITTEENKTPRLGERMKFGVQILSPLPGDIYTVTYTPVTSDSAFLPSELNPYNSSNSINVVDLTGDLTITSNKDQILIINDTNDNIVRSNLYLCIILRNTSNNPNLSPSVEEYTLLVGNQNQEKFQNGF